MTLNQLPKNKMCVGLSRQYFSILVVFCVFGFSFASMLIWWMVLHYMFSILTLDFYIPLTWMSYTEWSSSDGMLPVLVLFYMLPPFLLPCFVMFIIIQHYVTTITNYPTHVTWEPNNWLVIKYPVTWLITDYFSYLWEYVREVLIID